MDATKSPFLSAREAELAAYGPWIPARVQADCDGCGHVIMVGDSIRADGDGGHMCADCGEE